MMQTLQERAANFPAFIATTTDTPDDTRMFLSGARYVLRQLRAVANEPNRMFATLHELDCEITKLEAEQ